jgi:hypothetical protein
VTMAPQLLVSNCCQLQVTTDRDCSHKYLQESCTPVLTRFFMMLTDCCLHSTRPTGFSSLLKSSHGIDAWAASGGASGGSREGREGAGGEQGEGEEDTVTTVDESILRCHTMPVRAMQEMARQLQGVHGVFGAGAQAERSAGGGDGGVDAAERASRISMASSFKSKLGEYGQERVAKQGTGTQTTGGRAGESNTGTKRAGRGRGCNGARP